MTKRDTAPRGAPCWVDLSTSDAARARRFYTSVFGWEAEEPNAEFGGYFNFTRHGERIAGCMPAVPGAGVPDVWSVHLATDDVDKTLELAASNGGQVVVPAMQVGDLGKMSVVLDPGGAGVGAWQALGFAGFTTLAEHGAPGWFELHTRAFDEAVAFYRTVFGWEVETVGDSADFRYVTNGTAGIMDATDELAEGEGSHWTAYFWVDDADDAAQRIEGLGGSVLRAPEDTPYGRLAAVADPVGATFKLIAANEAMPAG